MDSDPSKLPPIEFPSSIKTIAIYNASHVTTELSGAFLSTLRAVYPNPECIKIVDSYSYDDETMLYIIICPRGIVRGEPIRGPKYYITYQLEGTHVLPLPDYKQFLEGALYNWDYSRINVATLKEMQIKAVYLPPGFSPTIAPRDILHGNYIYSDVGKDIDVLFLGWDIYPRRQKIKNELFAAGLRIWFVCGLNMNQMQDAIRRSKICLNMRVQDDMRCLETIRLNILLSNQACVVSESIIDPELDVYKHAIISPPYHEIVSTCVKLIHDSERRRQIAVKGHQWYRNEREWSKIVDFNSLLPEIK